MSSFLTHNAPISLLGGGIISASDVEVLRDFDFSCVAADGGAQAALDYDIPLQAVIGDFDSLSEAAKSRIPLQRRHHIPEQDSTDFAKCLRSITAPVILAVGFCGGRMDHQLAVLHTLVKYPDQPCVVLDQEQIIFHCPPRITLPTRAGDVVSLFPLTQVQGRSRGLKWPLDGHRFAPDHFVGTSNCALGEITLEMESPGMLCILPRRLLGAVIGIFHPSCDALRSRNIT